jgi:DoxX
MFIKAVPYDRSLSLTKDYRVRNRRIFSRLCAWVLLAEKKEPRFGHGWAQKVVGWFGGSGFASSMAFFTDKMGIPADFAFVAVLAEFLEPIALLFGFLTRIASLPSDSTCWWRLS